jgi:cytochrome c biogenesis protein CcdA
MLRLIGLVVSIGLADSLNPSTIAPALYLAGGERAKTAVGEFTAGVAAVYFVGGLAIALGPGRLLLSLVPRPGRHLSYILEIAAGVAMLTAAAFLWGYRSQLGHQEMPQAKPGSRSSVILGATISAVELPTAFPYFAAIAAIVGANLDVVKTTMLLFLFNLCFVAPLLGILATLAFAGRNAQRLLLMGRTRLEAHWPAVLSILALAAGLFVTFLGVTGLGSLHRNNFGSLSRRLRHLLHLHS